MLPVVLDYAAVAFVIFLGACLQGSGGVGFGMFAAPLLALWRPELVPGPLLVLGGSLSLMSAIRERAHIDFRGLGYALAGRIPASFVAGLFFVILPLALLSVVFALLVLAAIGLSLLGWRVHSTGRNMFVAGLASGFMGTITSVGAPPMAVVMQHTVPPQLRATIGAFLAVGAVVSILALIWVGRFGLTELNYGIGLLIPLLAGFAVSNRLVGRISPVQVRSLALGISGLAALALLVQQLV